MTSLASTCIGQALLEKIGAEPADAGDEVGKVRLALLLHPLAQMRRDDLLHHVVEPFLGGEGALDGDELPVDAEDDGGADLQVDVGGSAVHRGLQNAMEYFHARQGSRSGRETKVKKLTAPAPHRPFRPCGLRGLTP